MSVVSDTNTLLLSGFADEGAPDKTLDQQLSVMAALGLRYLTLRFVDCGNGVRNVLDLTADERQMIRRRLDDFGLKISSIGSPLGKVKIADIDDGTSNPFRPFADYLNDEVARALDAASDLDCRLIRGFSFYHPKGTEPEPWLNQATDHLAAIAERCAERGLTLGLEVEANLIGSHGAILRDLHAAVDSDALVLVFDGGNLVTQGYSPHEILEQFRQMLPGLGWLHVKDYAPGMHTERVGGYVDEERLDRFVPAGQGGSDYAAIFSELASAMPKLVKRLTQRGIDGLFVDLEPHLRGGGQFGGYSGPDGMGIALRALCDVLNATGLKANLRAWGPGGIA